MSHWAEIISLPFNLFVMEFETLFAIAPLLALGAVSTMGSLAGGIMSRDAQRESNRANQDNFQRQLREQKRQFNLNYRQQSIANQLNEMRQAGLNPASANTGVSSSPSSSPGTQLPNIIPENGDSIALSSMLRDAAEVANLSANTRKTNEEIDGVKWTNAVLESDAKFADAMHESQIKFQSSSSELNWTNVDRLINLTPLECEQLRAVTKQTLQLADNAKESLKLIRAQVANTQQNTKESEHRVKNMEQDIKESISREMLNYAKKHETDANIKYIEELTRHVDVQIGLDGIKCGIAGFDLRLLYDGGYDHLI